jgi:hypothetical protein
MYTEEMANSFHAIVPPQGFQVDLYDNSQFITIMVNPNDLVDISEERGQEIIRYIMDVKEALEKHGAIVLIVREELVQE